MTSGGFFDRFTGCYDAVCLLLRMHICEFQTRIRFARYWQDFIRPCLGITINGSSSGHLPVVRFPRRHFVDQLCLQRLDERL
jgi:hypothetical protein